MPQHPFPPLYDKNSKILILGSFPSVKSREQMFFYGHPQNRFWKVISTVLGQKTPITVDEKKSFLLSNNIALWDVIASCDITGSSDSSIKNVVANDLTEILDNADIKQIFVNGKTAEKYYNKYIRNSINREAICLPSTSPANAGWSLEKLINEWKNIVLERNRNMVRKATIDDLSSILKLYREQFKEMSKLIPDFIKIGDQSIDFIEKIIINDDSDILVYENDSEVVGFILLQAKVRPDFSFIVPGKYCYIMDLIVTEKYRDKGFGTALMNSAKDWAKERDCNFINLDVLSNNPRAITLYEKLGYIPKAQEMYLKLEK